jgi:hypothetical protein
MPTWLARLSTTSILLTLYYLVLQIISMKHCVYAIPAGLPSLDFITEINFLLESCSKLQLGNHQRRCFLADDLEGFRGHISLT